MSGTRRAYWKRRRKPIQFLILADTCLKYWLVYQNPLTLTLARYVLASDSIGIEGREKMVRKHRSITYISIYTLSGEDDKISEPRKSTISNSFKSTTRTLTFKQ